MPTEIRNAVAGESSFAGLDCHQIEEGEAPWVIEEREALLAWERDL